jgi:hypothetical protein
VLILRVTELLNNKAGEDKGTHTGDAGILNGRILDLELPNGIVNGSNSAIWCKCISNCKSI